MRTTPLLALIFDLCLESSSVWRNLSPISAYMTVITSRGEDEKQEYGDLEHIRHDSLPLEADVALQRVLELRAVDHDVREHACVKRIRKGESARQYPNR